MELAGGSIAAALTLAADSLARSGCIDSAICCAVSARLLGRPVRVSAAAGAPLAAGSPAGWASGGLKNTGKGDPPIGLPLMSTLS